MLSCSESSCLALTLAHWLIDSGLGSAFGQIINEANLWGCRGALSAFTKWLMRWKTLMLSVIVCIDSGQSITITDYWILIGLPHQMAMEFHWKSGEKNGAPHWKQTNDDPNLSCLYGHSMPNTFIRLVCNEFSTSIWSGKHLFVRRNWHLNLSIDHSNEWHWLRKKRWMHTQLHKHKARHENTSR